MIEAIQSAIETTGANIVFGVIVLVAFGAVILCFLFAGLAIRGGWRRLTRRTWNDVIRSTERKALR